MIEPFDQERDVLVFHRIPKTGSMSLRNMLKSKVPEGRWAEIHDRKIDDLSFGWRRQHDLLRRFGVRLWDDLAARLGTLAGRPDRVAEAIFISGHHPVWAPIRTGRRRRPMTVLRDPVERILSAYFYARAKADRRPETHAMRKRLTMEMDPDDYVTHVLSGPAASRLNGHCLYLARSGRFEDAVEVLRNAPVMAGLLEDLPAFSQRVADFMGVEPPEMRHDNQGAVRRKADLLSSKTLQRLREALEPDFRLHDAVASARG